MTPAKGRPSPRLSSLTPEERLRYSRQIALPEVGVRGQQRLKGSSVLVVGLGGLGLPASAYLAAAGVGRLGLADGDSVRRANLHRQILYSEDDIGLSKAQVARSRLQKANPNIVITAFPFRLDSSNAMRVLRNYDIILDATDNLPSRYLISDACALLNKADVYASAQGFGGQTTVFWAVRGPCFRCLSPQPPPPGTVDSCEESGVIGVAPAALGVIQALQALNFILGKGSSLVGRLLVFDGLDASFCELRLRKDPGCPVCGKHPTIRKLIDYEAFCASREPQTGTPLETTPLELDRMLKRGEKPLLLDVREPYEHRICRLRGSKLIPMAALRSRAEELDRERLTVVYCHHGIRSARAVRALRRMGLGRTTNLTGGIEAWRLQVDPTTPAY